MTVTMFSWTPPTTCTSRYLLRPTVLNGPRDTPLLLDLPRWVTCAHDWRPLPDGTGEDCRLCGTAMLEDIDDWYSQDIEKDGFLERLDRSAESVRFP